MKQKPVKDPAFKVKFWGVRGSVPSPIVTDDVEEKILRAICADRAERGVRPPEEFVRSLPFFTHGTYGGNTSCVEVCAGDRRIVLDMGTGARPLGNSLMKEMIANKGLAVTFLFSHMHWDHIQGMPFFAPLFANQYAGIVNDWTFFGGTRWQEVAESCFKGQMDPPTFPVSWKEIEKITGFLKTLDVCDMFPSDIGDIKVITRKLDHPQETYGWRMERGNKVLVYATDNEPRDPRMPAKPLVDLVKNADVLIADCQYTYETYHGLGPGGVQRYGWGHSYPEAIAALVAQTHVKHVILFHHDPASTDLKIKTIEDTVRTFLEGASCNAQVTAAYEGLELSV